MDEQTQPGGPAQPWGPPPDAASGTPPGEPPASPPSPPAPDAAGAPVPPVAPMPAPPPGPPVAWSTAPAVQPGIEVPGAPGIYFASMWARFAALFVDGVIVGLINLVIALVVGAVLGPTRTFSPTSSPFGTVVQANPAALAIESIAAVIVSYVYFTTQWRGTYRATFGQRAFSVQVGNAFDGVPLTSRQANLRWVALGQPLGLLSALSSTAAIGVLLLLVLELALFLTTLGSTTRQGWHDQLANSAVIRRPGTSGSNSCAVAIVVVVLVLGGIFLLGIISLIMLGGQISNILSDVGNSI